MYSIECATTCFDLKYYVKKSAIIWINFECFRCDYNKYTLKFIIKQAELKAKTKETTDEQMASEEDEEEEEEEMLMSE
jgi:hypothetical protein